MENPRNSDSAALFCVSGEPYVGAKVWTLLCIFAESGESVLEFGVGDGRVTLKIERKSMQATEESKGGASS